MSNTPEKAKAPAVGAAGALKSAQKKIQFSAKSTATEAQQARALEALRHRPQTSYQLRRMGIYAPAARIKELRDRFACVIDTALVAVTDEDGFTHARCALYTLLSGPEVLHAD